MSKFSLTIHADTKEELDDIVSKLADGKPSREEKPSRSRREEPADEPVEKPARRSARTPEKEQPDEKPASKKAAGKADDVRETVRAKLREYAEKTDRKMAVKLLNKFAESVDDVEEDDLDTLLDKIEQALDIA